MPNANTVGGVQNFPAYNTNNTTATAIPFISGGTKRAQCVIAPRADITGPGSLFDGHVFKVRATGIVTTSGTLNSTTQLYWDANTNTNLTTFTSDVTIATTGAVSLATATSNFALEAVLQWDSTSQLVYGYYTSVMKGLLTAPTVITNITANPASIALLRFFLVQTWGTANAANAITVNEFVIEQV